MKTLFSQEEQMLHRLVLHANDVPARGLFYGQMGIVLSLSEYMRKRHLSVLKNAVNFLLDQVLGHLDRKASLDFSDGLTGIGWGIEYLLQNKFQRGCGAEICAEIDQKMMERNLFRISDMTLDSGLLGWMHYLAAHLQGALKDGKEVFDSDYRQQCLEFLNRVECSAGDGQAKHLSRTVCRLLEGKPERYEFNLKGWVLPDARKEQDLLGLRNGLAGRLLLFL